LRPAEAEGVIKRLPGGGERGNLSLQIHGGLANDDGGGGDGCADDDAEVLRAPGAARTFVALHKSEPAPGAPTDGSHNLLPTITFCNFLSLALRSERSAARRRLPVFRAVLLRRRFLMHSSSADCVRAQRQLQMAGSAAGQVDTKSRTKQIDSGRVAI
jgi:hypothetical protein